MRARSLSWLIASCNCSPRRQSWLRIGRNDSSKNPVLASADETLAAYPQKFFYCQNSRLGVHAARFWTTRSRNHNAESALRMKNTN
jgi:hypothetical protein